MEMFRAFDPNGNGYLSLAEIDKGVRDVLKSDRLFEAKPAIMRAYQAAKNAVPGENKLSADFVERKEFRLLLLYLKRYFEIHSMFSEADSDHDHRVDIDEFKASLLCLIGCLRCL